MLDKLAGFGGTIAANEQVAGCTSTICIWFVFHASVPKQNADMLAWNVNW